MSRWRRSLLAVVASAVLASLALPVAAGAAVQARAADAFVDSIGIGVHLAYSDTPYVSQFATLRSRLEELGVRHVRDDLYPGREDQYERLRELAGAGIGSTLILGSPANGSAGLEDLLEVAASLDGVEALEGPNEYSTMGGDPNWIANLRAYQQELYARAKGDPALAALPVIGPDLDPRVWAQPPPPPPPPPEAARCTVPKLQGRTLAGARAALRLRDCSLGAVRGTRGRSSRVVRQWPRPGRSLPEAAAVRVKVGAR